jgi:hypothetical protein
MDSDLEKPLHVKNSVLRSAATIFSGFIILNVVNQEVSRGLHVLPLPFMVLYIVELTKLNGSCAINEVEFQCGICKKSFTICGDRTSEGKVKYLKNSKCN